jgi:hypothetical protein
MSEFKVYFEGMAGMTVTVEADDVEAAIEKAYNEIPSGVCAQCSGWGEKWSLDVPDEWALDGVADENGKTVYTEESA